MVRVKHPKNQGVLHFKKQLKKLSAVDKVNKTDINAITHYSGIIDPVMFASKFKDLFFCGRCSIFSLGKVKTHNCLVPLPINSPILNSSCEKLLKHFGVHPILNFRDPIAQMLSSISYDHLKKN